MINLALFLIEITRADLYVVAAFLLAALLLLGSIALAIKNVREQICMPVFNFVISPVLARRRRRNELHDKVDKLTEMTTRIEHEVNTNSGSSLKDAVGRIEKGQAFVFSKLRHNDQIAAECLFETDATGNFTFVNRAFCELLNVDKSDLLNRAWISRIEPSFRERVKNEWKDAIENKMPFDSRQNVIDGRDGEIFEVRVHALPHTDATGNLVGFFGHVKIS